MKRAMTENIDNIYFNGYICPITTSSPDINQETSLTTTLTQNTILQLTPPTGYTYNLVNITTNVPQSQTLPGETIITTLNDNGNYTFSPSSGYELKRLDLQVAVPHPTALQLITTLTTNTTLSLRSVLFDYVEITTNVPSTWPYDTYDSIAIKVGSGSWTEVPFSDFTVNTNTTTSQNIGGSNQLAIVINQYYDPDGIPGNYYIDASYNMGLQLRKFADYNTRRGIAYYTTSFSAPTSLKSFSMRLYHNSIGINSDKRDIAYEAASSNVSALNLQANVYPEEITNVPHP